MIYSCFAGKQNMRASAVAITVVWLVGHCGARRPRGWHGYGAPISETHMFGMPLRSDYEWTLHEHTNCYPGRGASEVYDVNQHTSSGPADEADRGAIATFKCMRRCEMRDGCNAFTTQPRNGELHCFLRANVAISSCDVGEAGKHFFTYVRKSTAAAPDAFGAHNRGRRLQLQTSDEPASVLFRWMRISRQAHAQPQASSAVPPT